MVQGKSGQLGEHPGASLSWLARPCRASLHLGWVRAPSHRSPEGAPGLPSQSSCHLGRSAQHCSRPRMAQPRGFLKITREHLLSGSPRLHPNLKKKKKERKAFKQNSWKWAPAATHGRKTGRQSPVRNRRLPVWSSSLTSVTGGRPC